MIHLANSSRGSVVAKIRQHQIESDVNADLGGQDLGMNPHEILETALAACTSLTLQMYAKRKNIALTGVQVEVNVTSEGAESTIARKIELRGSISVEDREKLMGIANKCPIHRLLQSHITIQTTGVD